MPAFTLSVLDGGYNMTSVSKFPTPCFAFTENYDLWELK